MQTSPSFSILGIQMNEALERLMGNEELLLEIVQAMVVDFESTSEQVIEKIDQQNFDWLIHYFHKLKGIAANLAAHDICIAAKYAEQAVKEKAWAQAKFYQNQLIENFGVLRHSLQAIEVQKTE